MSLLIQIFSIFILGLIGGASPGPILAASMAETLRGGLKKGFAVILKALISETIVAFLILILFFSFDIPIKVFYVISFAGAAMLIYMASQMWRINVIDEKKEIFSFKKILYLTFLNGPFWIFWITVCVPQAFQLKKEIFAGQFLFLLVFEIGWLLATSGINLVFLKFRKLLTKGKMVSVIFKIFALILIFFAVKLTIQSVIPLIN